MNSNNKFNVVEHFTSDAVIKAIGNLKRMSYDMGIVISPKKTLPKYLRDIKTLLGGLNSEAGLEIFTQIANKEIELPDSINTEVQKSFGMPTNKLADILVANWDTLKDYSDEIFGVSNTIDADERGGKE